MVTRSKLLAALLLVAAAVLGSSSTARADARCDSQGADAAAVHAARTAVQAACDCAGAPSAAAWSRCVRTTLKPLIGSGLSPACERHVRRVESRATCGRPGRSVCCRTTRSGRTTAFLRPDGRCSAPSGGTSCESPSAYLADGCTATGCIATTPECGNEVVESGESCDPPNGTTCSDVCSLCPPEGCTVPGQQVFCGSGPVTDACSVSITSQAACEQEGGCWQTTPFYPTGICNCPTRDAGKVCQGNASCEGLCLAGSSGCEPNATGACSDVEKPFGCWCVGFGPGGFNWFCVDH